jgi:uncharacterized membrane protein YebE (DUF533 family)
MFDAKKLLDLLVQSGSELAQGKNPTSNPNLGGMLGQAGSVLGSVFNQATTGVREVAGQIDARTGASSSLSNALSKASGGQSPGDLLNKAKELMGQNQLATGAAIGGLAALLLGTGGGRKVIGTAASMGGMALIGGLAFQAMQNYRAGKPLLDLQAAPVTPPPALAAPDEEARALRLVRAMIAAASADGIIDNFERSSILGNLKQAGLEDEASAFIEQEFAHPADLATLIQGIKNADEAAEVYAAARLSIDPDTMEERAFLHELAKALNLETGLVAHIDAAANAAKTG